MSGYEDSLSYRYKRERYLRHIENTLVMVFGKEHEKTVRMAFCKVVSAIDTILILSVCAGIIYVFVPYHLLQKADTLEQKVKKYYDVLQYNDTLINFQNVGKSDKYSYILKNNMFKNYSDKMKGSKYCTGRETGCFPTSDLIGLDGKNYGPFNQEASYLTKENYAIAFKKTTDSNDYGMRSITKDKMIALFALDINGQEGPNTIGKDIFFFPFSKNNGLELAGKGNESVDCNIEHSGKTCAYKVAENKDISYLK